MKTSNFCWVFIVTQKILPLQLRNHCWPLQKVFFKSQIPTILTTSYFAKWSLPLCRKSRVFANGPSLPFGDVVYGCPLIESYLVGAMAFRSQICFILVCCFAQQNWLFSWESNKKDKEVLFCSKSDFLLKSYNFALWIGIGEQFFPKETR